MPLPRLAFRPFSLSYYESGPNGNHFPAAGKSTLLCFLKKQAAAHKVCAPRLFFARSALAHRMPIMGFAPKT